ncbi:hypothetical protein [Thalassobaculum litoreum]|nr:hypothetical protein [Thalassobaculum litoreum]
MLELQSPWVIDPIGYLVRAKFPLLENAEKAQSEGGLGAVAAELVSRADAYRQELASVGPDEIARRAKQQRSMDLAIARRDPGIAREKRPFLRPESQAEFEYWAKMSFWSTDEAIALSLGREPAFSTLQHITWAGSGSDYAAEFLSRRQIVERAKTMGQLWDSTIPGVFLGWAERMQFPTPPDLVEAVRALGIQIGDWKGHYDRQKAVAAEAEEKLLAEKKAHVATIQEHAGVVDKMGRNQDELSSAFNRLIAQKDQQIESLLERLRQFEAGTRPERKPDLSTPELTTRERESLLKLVIGMAVGGYGLDPVASRSNATSEIASDIQRVGLSLDEDTVRKYLREARALLPRPETE